MLVGSCSPFLAQEMFCSALMVLEYFFQTSVCTALDPLLLVYLQFSSSQQSLYLVIPQAYQSILLAKNLMPRCGMKKLEGVFNFGVELYSFIFKCICTNCTFEGYLCLCFEII